MKCDLCKQDKDVLRVQDLPQMQDKDEFCFETVENASEIWCLQCIKANIKKEKYVIIPFRIASLLVDSMIGMSILKSAIKNENGL